VLCVFRTEQEVRGIQADPAPELLTDAPIPPIGMVT
jgi:hypothetical protein